MIHCTPRMSAASACCSAGSATLTTVPSMNAMLEPGTVATSSHRFCPDVTPLHCLVVGSRTLSPRNERSCSHDRARRRVQARGEETGPVAVAWVNVDDGGARIDSCEPDQLG